MHSIHLRDMHFPTGRDLWLLSRGALVCCSTALITFIFTWIGGGDELGQALGGDVTVVVLMAGILVSAASMIVTQPKDQAGQ